MQQPLHYRHGRLYGGCLHGQWHPGVQFHEYQGPQLPDRGHVHWESIVVLYKLMRPIGDPMARLAITEHERGKQRDEGFTLNKLRFASGYLAGGLLSSPAMVRMRLSGNGARSRVT